MEILIALGIVWPVSSDKWKAPSSSTVSARNAWHNDLPTTKDSGGGGYLQKNWVGVCGMLPVTLTLFQTKICDFSYPVSDLMKNSRPHFRPETMKPSGRARRVISCYGAYTVVGVNIKREMVFL